jgi:hypothetical protein
MRKRSPELLEAHRLHRALLRLDAKRRAVRVAFLAALVRAAHLTDQRIAGDRP